MKARRTRCITLVVGCLVLACPVGNDADTISYIASHGCPMAHCDRDLSDGVRLRPPVGLATVRWHDTSRPGSGVGLGCSSNGAVAICTFASQSGGLPNLTAYDADGQQLWSSSLLNYTAAASAPLVDQAGGAIAADNTTIVRYDPSGNVLWTTSTPGGTPISPNITDNGAVVLATLDGPISAYDVVTGTPLGTLWLSETLVIDGQGVSGFFDTINTPAIAGNRVYVSTQFQDSASRQALPYGRLYAIDVTRPDPGGPAHLAVAWYFPFQAPSGASPLIIRDPLGPVLYFDGNGTDPGGPVSPTLFAIRDLGSAYWLRWQRTMTNKMEASPAHDPRGGLWVWTLRSAQLLRLSAFTGAVRQTINVDALVNEMGTHMPTSAMSISLAGATPVMTLGAGTTTTTGSSYVLAIDLLAGALLWKVPLGSSPDSLAFGQFPIVTAANGQSVVVFSTFAGGVWGVTAE